MTLWWWASWTRIDCDGILTRERRVGAEQSMARPLPVMLFRVGSTVRLSFFCVAGGKHSPSVSQSSPVQSPVQSAIQSVRQSVSCLVVVVLMVLVVHGQTLQPFPEVQVQKRAYPNNNDNITHGPVSPFLRFLHLPCPPMHNLTHSRIQLPTLHTWPPTQPDSQRAVKRKRKTRNTFHPPHPKSSKLRCPNPSVDVFPWCLRLADERKEEERERERRKEKKRIHTTYLATLCIDLGMSTRDDFGLEGNTVGEGLLVCKTTNLEKKALGHVLVYDLKVQRPGRVQVGDDPDMGHNDSSRRSRVG